MECLGTALYFPRNSTYLRNEGTTQVYPSWTFLLRLPARVSPITLSSRGYVEGRTPQSQSQTRDIGRSDQIRVTFEVGTTCGAFNLVC